MVELTFVCGGDDSGWKGEKKVGYLRCHPSCCEVTYLWLGEKVVGVAVIVVVMVVKAMSGNVVS